MLMLAKGDSYSTIVIDGGVDGPTVNEGLSVIFTDEWPRIETSSIHDGGSVSQGHEEAPDDAANRAPHVNS